MPPPELSSGMDYPEFPPPLATPVTTVPYAGLDRRDSFPELGMPRLQAGVDVLLALSLAIGFMVLLVLSPVTEDLEEWLSFVGIFWTNIVTGLFSIGVVAMLVWNRKQSFDAVGLGRVPVLRVLGATAIAIPANWFAALACVLVYMAVAGVGVTGMVEERSEFFEIVPKLNPAVAILTGLFVGLHEELLFRGFILGRLQSVFRSRAAAIVVSGVLFGVIHFSQGPIGMVQTTAVGVVLATVVTYSRSIWPAILTHAFVDILAFVVIPLLQEALPELLEQATSMPAG